MIGIDIGDISKAVKKTVNKYGTFDLGKLCRMMDIQMLFKDMGDRDTSIKAMMIRQSRITCIVVNSCLSQEVHNCT